MRNSREDRCSIILGLLLIIFEKFGSVEDCLISYYFKIIHGVFTKKTILHVAEMNLINQYIQPVTYLLYMMFTKILGLV